MQTQIRERAEQRHTLIHILHPAPNNERLERSRESHVDV